MKLIPKIFHKEEKTELKRKGQIKQLALKKIKKIKRIHTLNKRFDEFVLFFRLFIEKTFEIKRNFTYRELVKELKSKKIKKSAKIKIRTLTLDIYDIEFKAQPVTKERVDAMFEKFENILEII